MIHYTDTHTHLDGEEFQGDLGAVVQRAREAGCQRVLVPAINRTSLDSVPALCQCYPAYAYPMMGLHPEEVQEDWLEVLEAMHGVLLGDPRYVAIGEVGLDYYWSRDYEAEQLEAFERQVQWSVELQLPLMIHCRKAQNEMVAVLRRYADRLPGGVFHCFTGNVQEAHQLLDFPGFVLGIGGVLTFKKSHLPETLPTCVPLDRIVLETDAPYMAPVPLRGQRNEPSFVPHVIRRLAEAYGVSEEQVCDTTEATVLRLFPRLSAPRK